jgi:exodeoxyribonuclease X
VDPAMTIIRVIDFETTGFPPNAGICEIGITDVICSEDQITVTNPQSWLCNPLQDIQPGAMGVHHITNDMIQNCPTPGEILHQRVQNGQATYYAAHNMQFELNFFQPDLPAICTLKCARIGWADAPDHKNQTLRYHLHVDAEEDFNIDFAMPPHRAGPDAYVTAFLLRKMIGGNIANIERLVKMSNQPNLMRTLPRFLKKHAGKTWEEVAGEDPGYLRWIVGNPRAEPDVKFTAQHWLNKVGG